MLFVANLLGKACLGGGKGEWTYLGDGLCVWCCIHVSTVHVEPLCERLVPVLEERTADDPLWQRVCHTVVTHLSQRSLEPVLDGLMTYCTPWALHSVHVTMTALCSTQVFTLFGFQVCLIVQRKSEIHCNANLCVISCSCGNGTI